MAAAIRESGGAPWVGIYDVSPDETAVVAWSGPSAAPSTTRSKIVAPVLDATGRVAGLLAFESDLPDAFGDDDRRRLEECALAITPFWW
jgi:putative methionine-R-sulfoxide reductase with GAF domain